MFFPASFLYIQDLLCMRMIEIGQFYFKRQKVTKLALLKNINTNKLDLITEFLLSRKLIDFLGI